MRSASRGDRLSALFYALSGPAAATSGVLADAFTTAERAVMVQALTAGLNAPVTSSAGRLFDAVAALIGLRYRSSFEGQAAMALEFAVDPAEMGRYPVRLDDEPNRFALVPTWHVPSWSWTGSPSLLVSCATSRRASAPASSPPASTTRWRT